VSSYYYGKTLPELPFLLLFPTIFGAIVYFMIGLSTDPMSKFGIFLLICVLESLCGNALGLSLGAMFSNVRIATALMPMIFIPLMLFSGFYVNRGITIRLAPHLDPMVRILLPL
jgi:ABC-type multidrug transport system permease subunit